MKILILTTISGTLNFFENLIEDLLDNGYEVHVASNFSIGNVRFDMSELVIHNIPFSRSIKSLDNLKARRELKEIVKKENFDLIHTHTPIVSTIIRTLNIDKKNMKIIYTAHGYHFFKGSSKLSWLFFYPIEKILSKHTFAIININKEDFKLSERKFKMENLFFVPGVGINLKKYSKKNTLITENKVTQYISIGELNDNKNHEFIINALNSVDKNSFKYRIVGEGSNRTKLQNLINELDLTDQIELLGFRNDISNLLTDSDVFLFPSKREGLPVSVQEALATGLPVIASDIRGNKDLIDDDVNGYLINLNSADELLNSMKKLKDKDNWKRISENNLRKAKKYDEISITKEYIKIYEYVINYE